MNNNSGPRPTAIDPPGCGCNECLRGEYIPLDCATTDHIAALLKGTLRNHLSTGTALTLTGTSSLSNPSGALIAGTVRVEYEEGDHHLTWDLHPTL